VIELREPVPARLRDARLALGLSLEDLAVLSGVSPSVLSRAERGLCQLSPEHRLRIVRALRLDWTSARKFPELAP